MSASRMVQEFAPSGSRPMNTVRARRCPSGAGVTISHALTRDALGARERVDVERHLDADARALGRRALVLADAVDRDVRVGAGREFLLLPELLLPLGVLAHAGAAGGLAVLR